MYEMMKKQNFGVEIELIGVTRAQAAKVIASYFGTAAQYAGDSYETWTAADRERRIWKAMYDGSIRTERREGDSRVGAGDRYACEVVTPILRYEDIEDLQNIVRALRNAGAFANASCGIHVHVDGANHTPESLTRLLNLAVGRQDLFYEALEIGARANRWCRKMDKSLLDAMKADSVRTKASMERIWYSPANGGYSGGIDHQHYNFSCYHGINLHAFFTKGTVEFRLFNGTTHAVKIKAYIQFCLAMSAWAIDCPDTKLHFKSCANYTQDEKARLMRNVLKNRLGLRGAEFKTCRAHLTASFRSGDAGEMTKADEVA